MIITFDLRSLLGAADHCSHRHIERTPNTSAQSALALPTTHTHTHPPSTTTAYTQSICAAPLPKIVWFNCISGFVARTAHCAVCHCAHAFSPNMSRRVCAQIRVLCMYIYIIVVRSKDKVCGYFEMVDRSMHSTRATICIRKMQIAFVRRRHGLHVRCEINEFAAC